MPDQTSPQQTPPEPPPTPQDDSEIRARLGKLEEELKKARAEGARHQSVADSRKALIDRLKAEQAAKQRPPMTPQQIAPPQVGQRTVPQAQQQEDHLMEVLDFADAQARELTLLKELARRGIKLEEVEGIQFSNETELKLQLDAFQQKKEIEELKKQLSSSGGTPPSSPQVDTGGRTVEEAQKQLAHLEELRGQARELRGKRQFQQATWLALRAAHADPDKVRPLRPGETGE